eukprot:5150135-Karenia_brevis.AAC.1
MRIRLGADIVSDDLVCASCGTKVLDRQAYHSFCCAQAESTKEHYKVRYCMLDGCRIADPGAAPEVPGLCESDPSLRPADVFTTAAHPTMTLAIDVGVKAPFAANAGEDCVETMKAAKFSKYASVLPELERRGIHYAPAIFGSFGRASTDTYNMMLQAAKKAAQVRGLADHKGLLARWRRQMAAAIWDRGAAM